MRSLYFNKYSIPVILALCNSYNATLEITITFFAGNSKILHKHMAPIETENSA